MFRRQLIAIVRKELVSEPRTRRVTIYATALMCGGLLFIAVRPSSILPPGLELPPHLTPVELGFVALALTSSIMWPVGGYLNIIQGEKRAGSFIIYRVLPFTPSGFIWGRILSCWLITITPIAVPYLMLFVIWLAGAGEIPSLRFFLFVLSLAWFNSTVVVGLGANIKSDFLALIVPVITILIVLFPFVFSQRVAGIDSMEIMTRFVENVGPLAWKFGLFFPLSLPVGWFFSWIFRKKRSYF